MKEIRLQKWISELGIASRREAEVWIRQGRLTVNGKKVPLGTTIIPYKDHLKFDGKPISQTPPSKIYWLLNKPTRVITSRRDPEGRRTLFDLPRLKGLPFQVSTVGRLDFHTEGLILLSNDGELVHRLMHPSFEVARQYEALVTKPLSPFEEGRIRKGIKLEDGILRVHRLQRLEPQGIGRSIGQWYRIEIQEGRNRAIRRLFEYFDIRVVRLIRTQYGPLKLDPRLEKGRYRSLTPTEIQKLKTLVGLERKASPLKGAREPRIKPSTK